MNDVGAFLDTRRCKNWAHENHLLKTHGLFCQFFSEHKVPHFWSPSWNPFRGCYRSAATSGHNLILIDVDGGGLVAKSCLTLETPWSVASQAPLSMGLYRQEYWRELPFPSPGDLPNPGIKPKTPALQADSLPSETQRKNLSDLYCCHIE